MQSLVFLVTDSDPSLRFGISEKAFQKVFLYNHP